ncbi:hypothetical protein [Lysinibacillus sp. NPDC056232]|uniref:hypothetical protein n=1 Tax=Lysinibacillus sp. NPDC056232 TaxID=3345756 RepID=UPI0035D74E6A
MQKRSANVATANNMRADTMSVISVMPQDVAFLPMQVSLTTDRGGRLLTLRFRYRKHFLKEVIDSPNCVWKLRFVLYFYAHHHNVGLISVPTGRFPRVAQHYL